MSSTDYEDSETEEQDIQLELEEAEGVMNNGQWTDFDPVKPIKAVE